MSAAVKDGRVWILMEARLCALFKTEKDYEILEKFPGQKLYGISYKPLFPYFQEVMWSNFVFNSPLR